ncbi:hypothetical protein FisN_9Hh391 [Fistulifera solaris]|uniref:Uncharacterized protein n=1 Tax=Fistulifera solaris TaxID=1519565 RepID=A0A1Z5KDV1_FISSO|nr:hypothetical protein FisN_9Hh391 [Fistulifera solaris]|eukprot:GAX24138.1 hypothetical protein FisN_9Hh391 [Fistulifera solaris]
MAELSGCSHHSNNSLQDLFESSLNRFLDEPGHLSALEMVLNDSSYLKNHYSNNSSRSLLGNDTKLLETSSSSFDPEISQEFVKGEVADIIINRARQTDMEEEIKKLREEKIKLEKDLKAKRERKKRRALKKKRNDAKKEQQENEVSPVDDNQVSLANKDEIGQEKAPEKIEDELNRDGAKEVQAPMGSVIKVEVESPNKTSFKRMVSKKESSRLRELYTDTGSLLLEGYIRVDGSRRRHSSHERPTCVLSDFTNSEEAETNPEKESTKASVSEQSNTRKEKRRHSSCEVPRKAQERSTSYPIREIKIVKKSKKDPSKKEGTLQEEGIKAQAKDDEGNIKKGKTTKHVKKVKCKDETAPKATKTKGEVTLIESEMIVVKDEEPEPAALLSKKERLKKFETERGLSSSPSRIRSKKRAGLANNPPPKCILDALNWASRNGIFGMNNDQTRRARLIAAHRREKFEELVSEYDQGVIRRRHSVSS